MTAATNILGLESEKSSVGCSRYAARSRGPVIDGRRRKVSRSFSCTGSPARRGTGWSCCRICRRRIRVLAVDLPGHGGSARPPRGTRMNDFAAVAAAVVAAEARGPALVAGHSFGGLVAVRLAQARPELVRGLLLVAPAGIATTTRATRAVVLVSTTVRPGRWVAPLSHRYAERAWYRRALFRPWFVSDPAACRLRARRTD